MTNTKTYNVVRNMYLYMHKFGKDMMLYQCPIILRESTFTENGISKARISFSVNDYCLSTLL